MTVKVGDCAPPVRVEAYVRNAAEPVSVEIGESKGSWTVLFFYPRDFAFVIPAELRDFAELEANFAAEDAIVMAASTDSWYVHRAWFGTAPALRNVAYPVIADPTQELTRLFGVLDAADGSARPATVIIDPDGIVRHASVSNGILRAGDAEDALCILRALRSDERSLQVAA
jgi:peroxiredoxin (alkyl hydroperoxide reductase subunit C)